MVVRDLWLAVLRLTKVGGDDCLSMLVQLAAKWKLIEDRKSNAMYVAMNPSPDAYAQLKGHIQMAKTFTAALEESFARTTASTSGARRERRNAAEIAEDDAREREGDSSSRMDVVWDICRCKVQERLKELARREFDAGERPGLAWAWQKRFPSAPPYHSTFTNEADIEPLDPELAMPRTSDVPPLNSGIKVGMTLTPFTKADKLLLNPFEKPVATAPATTPDAAPDAAPALHPTGPAEGTRSSARLAERDGDGDKKKASIYNC